MALRWLAESSAFKNWNGAENVNAVVTALAAHWFQQEQRKQALFEESARARAIGFVSIAFPALELREKPTPPRGSRNRHTHLPRPELLL
jgi:hypothetical protein